MLTVSSVCFFLLLHSSALLKVRETPSQFAHDHLSFCELAHGELSSHKNKTTEICKLVFNSADLSSPQACSRPENKQKNRAQDLSCRVCGRVNESEGHVGLLEDCQKIHRTRDIKTTPHIIFSAISKLLCQRYDI